MGMSRERGKFHFFGGGCGNMGFGPTWLLVWIIILPNESNFSNSQMPRIKNPK
jgi:Synergist-CTERM protein sorting domain-containing protein